MMTDCFLLFWRINLKVGPGSIAVNRPCHIQFLEEYFIARYPGIYFKVFCHLPRNFQILLDLTILDENRFGSINCLILSDIFFLNHEWETFQY